MTKSNSSDEEDYMSDALLAKCDDQRPGLVPERIARLYKKEVQQKALNTLNRQQNPSTKAVEAEQRNLGLNNALTSANKGFRLLEKMGYKPGMAIGKAGNGKLEPVSIEIKSDRVGLGEKTERKRKESEQKAMRAAMAQKRRKHESEWRQNVRARFADRETEKDLAQSQKVCEQLDSENGVTSPVRMFFWPTLLLPEKDEDADESEEEVCIEDQALCPSEKLELLTKYLRTTYCYCVWCGTTFEDEHDLRTNCPGDTQDAH